MIVHIEIHDRFLEEGRELTDADRMFKAELSSLLRDYMRDLREPSRDISVKIEL